MLQNEATFTVVPDDLIAANRLHFKKLFSSNRWRLALLVSGAMTAMLVYGVDLGMKGEDFLFILAGVWAFVLTICLLGWLLIPRQARRTWGQAKKLWIETEVRWSKDNIQFKNARGESQVQWSDYHRWTADERSILLYQDERSFFLLPMRQFPTDARETITGYLVTAGVRPR